MAKTTKQTLAPTPAKPTPPQGQTQRAVQGVSIGSQPRTLPPNSAMTNRMIDQGRALGRDLSPGHKVETLERNLTGGTKEGA